MRRQRLSALARLISLRRLFLDAAAAFFNPPSLPIFRMKSGVNLMMMGRRLTTPQSTLCRGSRRPRTRASASVSSNATSLIPAAPSKPSRLNCPNLRVGCSPSTLAVYLVGNPEIVSTVSKLHRAPQSARAESLANRRTCGKRRATPRSFFPALCGANQFAAG